LHPVKIERESFVKGMCKIAISKTAVFSSKCTTKRFAAGKIKIVNKRGIINRE